MKITIELDTGPNYRLLITKDDINGNIEVIDRAICGKLLAKDYISLTNTKSILEAIKDKLPE